MLWLLIPHALAAPTAISFEQALRMEMPPQHGPFIDCSCVALAWPEEERFIEVPIEQVAQLEHRFVEDAPDTLHLVTTRGDRITLESAPCSFIADQAMTYHAALGVEVVHLNAAGEPGTFSCPDPLRIVRYWEQQYQERHTIEVVRGLDGIELASLGVEAIEAEEDRSKVSRSLRAMLGRAPSCSSSPEELVLQLRGRGAEEPAAIKVRKTSGDAAVDRCVLELAREFSPRDLRGKGKLMVTVALP